MGDADPLLGRMVGPYRIDALLGVGASGRVYRAEHVSLLRRAAVKVFAGHVLEPGNARERFLREAGALTRLEDGNVVRLYDASVTDDEIPYLAMEWIDGVTLADQMKVGLTRGRAILIGSQVARGLAAIHDAGFVHRDLKPTNVMLTSDDGTVKIVDFGIVRSQWFPTITAVDSIVGTPRFMAPEQLLESRSASAAADLYALGAMLFLMFTGEPHVHGVDLKQIITAQLSEVPPSLEPTYGEVGALVDRMLDKIPEARPSAAEVAAVFAGHAPEEPTEGMTRVLTEVRSARQAADRRAPIVVPTPLTQSDALTTTAAASGRPWLASAAAFVVVAAAAGWLTMRWVAPTHAPVEPSPPERSAQVTPRIAPSAVERTGAVPSATERSAEVAPRMPSAVERSAVPSPSAAKRAEAASPSAAERSAAASPSARSAEVAPRIDAPSAAERSAVPSPSAAKRAEVAPRTSAPEVGSERGAATLDAERPAPSRRSGRTRARASDAAPSVGAAQTTAEPSSPPTVAALRERMRSLRAQYRAVGSRLAPDVGRALDARYFDLETQLDRAQSEQSRITFAASCDAFERELRAAVTRAAKP
ncbi:MAG: protein kinase [Deltaproteobacteria bacterium]